jgi:hypothetical protein
MSPDEQETYIDRLAKLGYCWQFITLAGLHTTALISGMNPTVPLHSIRSDNLDRYVCQGVLTTGNEGLWLFGTRARDGERR